MKTSLLISLLLSCLVQYNSVDAAKKLAKVKHGVIYKTNDPVHLIVNSVGPFNNPTEKYRFYSLPFCHTHQKEDSEVDTDRKGAVRHKQRLGESMAGDRRESSPYALQYGTNVENRILCEQTLDTEQLKLFKDAIANSYYFEMYVEDLPMSGFIGDIVDEDVVAQDIMGTGEGKTYLFPHLHFSFGMNENKIVSATVSTDTRKKVDISEVNEPKTIQFTYSVEFVKESLPWKHRMTRYTNSMFAPTSSEIHWLSIINSCVLVLLLTAFLAIIFMRVLKNDFSNYMDIEEETLEEEESGWKLIHGDVFRFPQKPTFFCAAVGTGNQLMATTILVLMLALTGKVSTTRRGSILAAAVIVYSLTSTIAGYTATKLYFQMNGKMWARCVLLTSVLFPLPVAMVFAWVNSVAIAHGSISALPFGAFVTIIFMYSFVCVPLTLFGGILAKNYGSKDLKAPTRTTKVAREIPTETPFLKSRPFQMLVAGFIPFSAIYIELHYIFTSMWGHQIYALFGILFFAFVLLVIVTSCITVSLLYFQLTREDHRWWWSTFTNGGMIGFFIYAYSFYFYFQRSGMTGLLQSSFYFGYMAIISFAFFLMLGSAGFQLSLQFVKYIYARVKCD
mmetsp:Transcript_3584/g.4737  ORF Transcript_3584/g.4737 Transcript_3584/m.4737 type:complete len:617 (+) Transcript_3584:85-1935(+)